MSVLTYADLVRPASRWAAVVFDTAAIAVGSLFVALMAQVSFELHFGPQVGPVPITGQTLAVLLAGALLGSRRGVLCLLLYLAEGSMGLPVFANATAGVAKLIGPTGGYLVGFVGAAWLVGYLTERGWDRHFGRALAAMSAGSAVILAAGLAWLTVLFGFERALALGLYPFLLGTAVKILVAAALVTSGWKWMPRRGQAGRA